MNKTKNGQVSLVVLLVAAVITTLGLSLSKKTVLETKIDIDDELQKQAFNSAESGIEYFLGTGTTTGPGKATYQSSDRKTVADISIQSIGNTTVIDFNERILPGGYQYFWLVGHASDGGIDYATLYGGNSVEVCAGGGYNKLLAINYFYREGVDYKVERKMLNFSDTTINNVPKSTVVGGCVGVGLTTGQSIVPLLLTVSPVILLTDGSYNFSLKAVGASNFPSQGNEITAVGQAGDLTGTNVIKSRVRTLDRYQVLPFMLEPLSAMGAIGP